MATDEELWEAAGIHREGTGPLGGGGVYVTSARLRAVYNAGLKRAAETAEVQAKERMRKYRTGSDAWYLAQNLSVGIPAAIRAERVSAEPTEVQS